MAAVLNSKDKVSKTSSSIRFINIIPCFYLCSLVVLGSVYNLRRSRRSGRHLQFACSTENNAHVEAHKVGGKPRSRQHVALRL